MSRDKVLPAPIPSTAAGVSASFFLRIRRSIKGAPCLPPPRPSYRTIPSTSHTRKSKRRTHVRKSTGHAATDKRQDKPPSSLSRDLHRRVFAGMEWRTGVVQPPAEGSITSMLHIFGHGQRNPPPPPPPPLSRSRAAFRRPSPTRLPFHQQSTSSLGT